MCILFLPFDRCSWNLLFPCLVAGLRHYVHSGYKEDLWLCKMVYAALIPNIFSNVYYASAASRPLEAF